MRWHSKCRICSVLVAALAPLAAQKLVFNTIPKETVIARLQQAPRDNREREEALRKLFEAAGCNGPRLQEQPVKHLKIPNLICELNGQTDLQILVTAHTDHVKKGDGTGYGRGVFNVHR